MKLKLALAAILWVMLSVAHAQPSRQDILENFAIEADPRTREVFGRFFANGNLPSPGSPCRFEWAASEIDELSRAMKLGNSFLGITKGHTFAGVSAACGLAVQDRPDAGVLANLGYWARFAGIGLHAAIMLGLPSDTSPMELDRAIAYFRYAQSTGVGNNQQPIDQLLKLRAKFKH